MAQPLLARLRAKPGAGPIDVLAPPWVAPVVRRMAEVDEVIEADLRHGALQLGERWRLGRMLKARAYTEAYVLPNTFKAALIPFFAGIPARIGYHGEARLGLLNRTLSKGPDRESMANHYARLSGSEGTDLPRPSLTRDPKQIETTLARFGLSAPYVALCPGAEYGPAKRWPYFRELAVRIGGEVLVLGAKSDLAAAEGIAGRNLVGQTSLDDAVDLIAGAALVVSNDSGLMHVAAAVGTPLVAIFGSSSPEHTPPQSPAARVLWLKIECSPCFERVCPLGHFRCMRELTVDAVLAEIRKSGTVHDFRQT
jgi:heptosyltransferase II